jgi:hypothetical protein
MAGGGHPGERPAFSDPLWDDGQAEVASYRAVERRYGELREGTATLIVVSERFDADALVKDDGPVRARHTLGVMKLNHSLTIPTGVYTYQQMASAFLARGDARAVKLTVGSQEWCGVTHKRLVVRNGRATLHGSSYFGGEAERAFDVPLDDRTVFYDALPLWLRTLDLSRPGARQVRLVSQQLTNRVRAPEVAPARITVGRAASLEVPAGRFEAVPVTVVHHAGRDVYHLDARAPHALVRWDRSDGGRYTLLEVRRARYWELHDVGDTFEDAP